jgi:hypothetical protein
MTSGQFAEAAIIFKKFADGSLDRNGPRAPWFFLRAGQAWLLAGQVPVGMASIQQGLSLFAGRGQFQRLNQAGMRFVSELAARGLTAEAKQIEDYLKTTLPAGFVPATGGNLEKSKPALPTVCPGCGGPIHSNEVEWTDELTAECPYCGRAMRAQG